MPNSNGHGTPITPSTPFTLTMSDDALVTFGAPAAGGVAFHDVGFMPVNAVTIAGMAVDQSPGNGHLFIRYVGDGIQSFNAQGQPTAAVYSDLHYELVRYNGAGKFGHGADGSPTVKGVGNPTVIGSGDLLKGELDFTQSGGIQGTLSATFQSGGQTVGTMNISVQHAAGDVHFLAGGSGLTLDGGLLQAVYTPLQGG